MKEEQKPIEMDSVVQNIVIDTMENVKAQIIDVYTTKMKYMKYYTSTFLTAEESKIYHKPNKNGYFGSYDLFQKEENKPIVLLAEMVIFNDEKPWWFENKTDEFIEITIYHKGILLFDSIGVGDSVKKIVSLLGAPIASSEKTKIFKFRNYFIAVQVKNNVVEILKAGRYNHNLDDREIINYLKTKFLVL